MTEYPKKVLLATDRIEDSARATAARVAFAGRRRLSCTWSTAGKPQRPRCGVAPPRAGPSRVSREYAEREARQLLERQVEGVWVAGGTVTKSRLRMGHPPTSSYSGRSWGRTCWS